ncbi:hypothetical protein [Azotosporobacter soli]|uniref:hypothetical protein n=1 Tax=Azotosporobacter soli TaxID=3055040 RepID=UPI0031FF3F9D
MKKAFVMVLAVAILALGSVMAFAATPNPMPAACPGQQQMVDRLVQDNVLSAEKANQFVTYMQANCPMLKGENKNGGDMAQLHKNMMDKVVADGVLTSEEATKVNEYMTKNCPMMNGHHGKGHMMMGGGQRGGCMMNQTSQTNQ